MTISTALSAGLIYFFKKSFKDIVADGVKRTEYTPGANGRLIVNEYKYHSGMLVSSKTRYATVEEEWKYSKEVMDDHLSEMRLI